MSQFKAPPDPPGCVDALEHERRLTASADELERVGRELLQSDGRIDIATGNQLMVSAIRARRAAAELAAARLEKSYGQWLVAEYKQMHGVLPTQRAPLKLRRKGNP